MTAVTDLMPVAGTIGGRFFLGLVTGYAIKKLIKIVTLIIGLFIAALAYLEYQRIVNVDWNRIQEVSQNGVTWLTDAIMHISSTIGATHSGILSNVGIPLASSASAGLMLGFANG